MTSLQQWSTVFFVRRLGTKQVAGRVKNPGGNGSRVRFKPLRLPAAQGWKRDRVVPEEGARLGERDLKGVKRVYVPRWNADTHVHTTVADALDRGEG